MQKTKNAFIVEKAIQSIGGYELFNKLSPIFEDVAVGLNKSFDVVSSYQRKREPYAQALSLVNNHITIRDDLIEEAGKAYEGIANILVEELNWEKKDIKIFPQGSASTKTLIRTVGNRNFDIDAVCEVNISVNEAENPMAFFEAIGNALKGIGAEAKRRCWTINYAGKPFYVEFTPSVPLNSVSLTQAQTRGLKLAEHEFLATALAVVDTPSKNWKTSNPAGIRDWVNRAAERIIVIKLTHKSFESAQANIQSVDTQSVEVEETLRVAIRLFKRHRDMCVARGYLESEYQPISIILVTLLTMCYEGLADLIQQKTISSFQHVVDALIAIANLLPEMIPRYPNGQYYLNNPTVVDENFAERWNTDNGERAKTFRTWCELLKADLQSIIIEADPSKMRVKTLDVFGCTDAGNPKGEPSNGDSNLPVVPPAPKAAPRTTGLA